MFCTTRTYDNVYILSTQSNLIITHVILSVHHISLKHNLVHTLPHTNWNGWWWWWGGGYIKVQIQETWGLKHTLNGSYFGVKFEHELEVWFLNLGGVFSCLGTDKMWQESGATLMPLHFLILWTPIQLHSSRFEKPIPKLGYNLNSKEQSWTPSFLDPDMMNTHLKLTWVSRCHATQVIIEYPFHDNFIGSIWISKTS